MRFDDSLNTVLAQDVSTSTGAQIAWRQLVDLVGRGRVSAPETAIATLRDLRGRVPASVRAASARALAITAPGEPIVGFFAEDDVAIAAPVLRMACLSDAEWIALLPALAPGSRAVLRHRRDLSAAVLRALESFGPVDFVLPAGAGEIGEDVAPSSEAIGAAPDETIPLAEVPAGAEILPLPAAPSAPQAPGPFLSFGSIARDLPVVAEARRHAEAARAEQPGGPFLISDLVARIDAYRRQREEGTAEPIIPMSEPAAVAPESFRFETDAAGVIHWVDAAPRGALIGLSIDLAGAPHQGRVDAAASGAFRARQPFSGARLEVAGESLIAGEWRLSAVPVFDRETGRFTGYRGAARRPRREESAAPVRVPGADSFRQLVHELRTPTTAISGFAEMIEAEMLGPVPSAYREQAYTIKRHAADLLAAIEDVDLAARLQSRRLDLRSGELPLAPLLARVADDLQPLAQMRGATISLPDAGDWRLAVDERAGERLLARMMATLVAACGRGEALALSAAEDGDHVLLSFSRPAALAKLDPQALLAADDERQDDVGAPLLGTGFALRLVRNLAAELNGALEFDPACLTLRLPLAVIATMERASAH